MPRRRQRSYVVRVLFRNHTKFTQQNTEKCEAMENFIKKCENPKHPNRASVPIREKLQEQRVAMREDRMEYWRNHELVIALKRDVIAVLNRHLGKKVLVNQLLNIWKRPDDVTKPLPVLVTRVNDQTPPLTYSFSQAMYRMIEFHNSIQDIYVNRNIIGTYLSLLSY